MKTLAALSLLASLTVAPLVVSAAESKSAPAAAPAAGAAAVKEIPKLKEPVTGYLFTRKNGSYVNLFVEGNNFVARFYNAKKEEMKPDVQKMIVRFRRFGRDSRYLLAPAGDDLRLTSTIHVERPYRFTVTVLIFKPGTEETDESFVQLFHQPMAGDGESISGDELTPEQAGKVKK